MHESNSQTESHEIFLGVDGGQSHTEAIIADESGRILGRGFGGASNHAEVPGGRERLQNAVTNSVGEALKNANLPPLEQTNFAAAHFGMTGGADYKYEIISNIIKTDTLMVGHDAPTALFGATAGKPGIVVISGTGSVIYGENESGKTTQIGGLGFLFSDEGSGFWLAAQTIRLAIKEQDKLLPDSGLQEIVLNFFGKKQIREITSDYYNAKISRDKIASLAKAAAAEALAGNRVLCEQITYGAEILAESVLSAANSLNFAGEFPVSGVGGMFRGALFKKYYIKSLSGHLPHAVFIEPRFTPPIGALLLAYRQKSIDLKASLLTNLEKTRSKTE